MKLTESELRELRQYEREIETQGFASNPLRFRHLDLIQNEDLDSWDFGPEDEEPFFKQPVNEEKY